MAYRTPGAELPADGPAPPDGLAARTDERLANAMFYMRAGTAALVAVPLIRWRRLRRPWLAAGAVTVAAAQTAWYRRRTRRTRTLRDPVLLWGDVGGWMLVNLLTSRSVDRDQRNSALVQAVSHSLAGAGTAGLGVGRSAQGAAATGALVADWVGSVWPCVGTKLVSDVLGFGMWYLSLDLVAREFRDMAALVEAAQARALAAQEETAERRRDADLARERELTHREIHEHLLPVVDAVAAGRVGPDLARVAVRAAARARRLIVDGRTEPEGTFAALVDDVVDTYLDAGLPLTTVVRIVADPPAEVGEAVAGALREALTNVLKYATATEEVTLYVEATESGVEAVVRDRGPGFEPSAVRPGGGFLVTFPAVYRRGGSVDVSSRPGGGGTRVGIRWPSPAG
jgi:signal transduction histidine kinase